MADWKIIGSTEFTDRHALEGDGESHLGFRRLKVMEFLCGLHLARFARDETLTDLRQHVGDPAWEWAFRLAIEAPLVTGGTAKPFADEVLVKTLHELFAPPSDATRLRPTELMDRAWPLLEETPTHLRAFAEQPPLLRGGAAVIARYRQAFQDLLAKQNAMALAIRDEFQTIPAGKFRMGSPKKEQERGTTSNWSGRGSTTTP